MNPTLPGRSVFIALVSLAGCADGQSNGPVVEIAIAPLRLPNVGDVCYGLTVLDGDPASPDTEPVWHEPSVCSQRYGNQGGGDVAYVGPCDADPADPDGENYVRLVLNSIQVAAGEGSFPIPGAANFLDDQVSAFAAPPAGSNDGDADFANPCPAELPCTLAFECQENRDTRVTFNLTVMVDASQGFFDIAVNFDDIFCSAKYDSCYDGGAPIELLFGDDSERDRTGVFAMACTAGSGSGITTDLLVSRVNVACPGGTFFHLPLSGLTPAAGNHAVMADVAGDATPESVQYATYFGREALACGVASCNKTYLSLAVNLEDLPSGCSLSLQASAQDAAAPAFSGGRVTDLLSSGATYPFIAVRQADLSQTGCVRDALDDGGSVATFYGSSLIGGTAPELMCDHSLFGGDPAAISGGEPVPERCGNQVDDDCDGLADEDCCTPSAGGEVCDRVDNDCDGDVDEGFGVGLACSIGAGECLSTGFTECAPDGASSVCDAPPAPDETIQGAYTITDQASVDRLSCVIEITQGLHIPSTSLGAITLPRLQRVFGGGITATDNQELAYLSAPVLSQLASLTLTGNPFSDLDADPMTAAGLDLPLVASMSGGIRIVSSGLGELDLPSLTTTGFVSIDDSLRLTSVSLPLLQQTTATTNQAGYLSAIFLRRLPALDTVELSVLTTISGEFTVQESGLSALTLDALTHSDGLRIIDNPVLQSVSAVLLESATGALHVTGNPLADNDPEPGLHLPSLRDVSGQVLIRSSGLEVLDLSQLVGPAKAVIIWESPELVEVDLSALVGTTDSFNLRGHLSAFLLDTSAKVETLLLANLTTLSAELTVDGTALSALDVSALVTCGGLRLRGNSLLRSVDAGALTAATDGLHVAHNDLGGDLGLQLPLLAAVSGNVRVEHNSHLKTLDLTELEGPVRSVAIHDNPDLEAVDLSDLIGTTSDVNIRGYLSAFLIDGSPLVSDVRLDSLASLSADFTVTATRLESLSLDALTTSSGRLRVSDNAQLQVITAMSLVTMEGGLEITGNPLGGGAGGVPGLNVPLLSGVSGSIRVASDALAVLDLSEVVGPVQWALVLASPQLHTIDFSRLSGTSAVVNAFGRDTAFAVRELPLLTSLAVPALGTLPGGDLTVQETGLGAFQAGALTSLGGGIFIDSNPALTSVSLAQLSAITHQTQPVSIQGNPNLSCVEDICPLVAQLDAFFTGPVLTPCTCP